MGAASIRQDHQRERWMRDILAIDARGGAVARDLDDVQLDWHPPEGGWSIGQVLEHLCIANEGYLERIGAIARDLHAPRASSPQAEWRPSWMGGMLASSLAAPRRLRAPRRFRPGPRPRPQVLDEFLQRQTQMGELLVVVADFDWRRNRTTSPISPLIRLNLGDCFAIVVVHGARHMAQIERIRAHPAFPAAGATTRAASP